MILSYNGRTDQDVRHIIAPQMKVSAIKGTVIIGQIAPDATASISNRTTQNMGLPILSPGLCVWSFISRQRHGERPIP